MAIQNEFSLMNTSWLKEALAHSTQVISTFEALCKSSEKELAEETTLEREFMNSFIEQHRPMYDRAKVHKEEILKELDNRDSDTYV